MGSEDGINFMDLYVFDENVHTGWNYIEWFDFAEKPKFRFYRFEGSASKACNVNEIEFYGAEVLDDEADSTTCAPEIILKGQL